MARRHFILISTVYLLFALSLSGLTAEVRKARQDVADAREMALESEQYQVQVMNITMYAPLSAGAVEGQDFTGDPQRTASGDRVIPGKTAAAGPNIPFGTRIYVEGVGWHTVNDRGGAIGPNDIDLAVASKEEAIKFGRQRRLVILTQPDN